MFSLLIYKIPDDHGYLILICYLKEQEKRYLVNWTTDKTMIKDELNNLSLVKYMALKQLFAKFSPSPKVTQGKHFEEQQLYL